MSNAGYKYLIICLLLIFSASVAAEEIHGAGATFPALLYQKWPCIIPNARASG